MDKKNDNNNKKKPISAEVSSEVNINKSLNDINALLKKRNFQEALEECDSALQLFNNHEKLQEKKIKILCHQGRFEEAYELALSWNRREPQNPIALKEKKRLKIVIQALKDQESDDEDNDDNIPEEPEPTDNTTTEVHEDLERPNTLTAANIVKNLPSENTYVSPTESLDVKDFRCTFCDIKFSGESELETHCRSDLHKKKITSDDDQNWEFRIPPRGLSSDEYSLCRRFAETGKCTLADLCTQAHSSEELLEWKERFKFRKNQIKVARDKHLHGTSYAEQLMEKLVNAENPKSVIVSNVEYSKVHINSDLKVSTSTKKSTNAWTFTITSKRTLHRVTLLDDTNRTYFYMASISVGPKKTQKYQNLENLCQEWINPDYSTRGTGGEYVYRIKVVFKTDIYGTFRQTLVLDFGLEPVLSQELQVDSAPVTDTEKVTKDITLTDQGRWKTNNVQLVQFDPRPIQETEMEKHLLAKYCLPEIEDFRLSEHLMHLPVKESYRIWMHEMLYIEEWAKIDQIARFNVKTSLQLVNRFLLVPGALSGAKYAQGGELFARLELDDVLSEDSAGGRLILMSSHIAWIAPYNPNKNNDKNPVQPKVYECIIEDKGKNFIFLRLSNQCVSELNLSCDQDFHAQVQFQLNRLPMCEMHAAIDRLPTLDLVFPPLDMMPSSNWAPERVILSETVSQKLNDKQKEAVWNITSESKEWLPPLLLVGPYGTGKTYTLAQAAKQALEDPDSRILICTHSNSAADLYIKEFIHPLVKEGNLDARPLRIYYRHRWVQTVPDIVLQYCLLEMSASQGNFRMPTHEDVEKHRIIITTLSTARYLCDLELPTGFFTHIFLDEAAQAMEGEMLIPISLASKDTRIVLAGDHMQLNPEIFADFARQQGFQRSLLERLYDLYPEDSPCKIMLVENYRSHADIIDFTSDLFYDGKLTASGNQPKHDTYHPLTFFATRGEEVQHENATGFYNISEIHEIIDRVDDLHKNWPKEWGELGDGGIGIVAPYSDQVWRIRSELRKKKFYNISVEKVMNVQGKQFRVLILSTVRTRSTCSSDSSQEDYLDYGFLSNEKLLNTAITRAQSLVIVVGDPLSLCLVGKCRKVWEHYLEICNEHGSFLGMTWNQLKAQLNSAEMRKTFVLNPLAPEFVPNRLLHINRMENVHVNVPGLHGQPHHPASASHYMGQRMMYPGAVYPHHMYPPYLQMPYQHLYNPFMYHRPYLPYHHLMGGGLHATSRRSPNKVAYPRAGSPVGYHGNPKRSGERDKVSPEALRVVDSPPLVSKKVANNAHHSRTMVYMPRMPPTAYPPMYFYPPQAYGGYYYMPDDPRLAAMQHPHHQPYLQHHPFTSISPHPGGLHHASPLRPYLAQQHSPESANALGEGDQTPEKGSPHRGSPLSQGKDLRPYSPSLSPGSTVAGQPIRLLPNVKHVPEHLISGARAHTPNNSRSSTPHRTDSPEVYQQDLNNRKDVVGSPEEQNYFKTVSPVLDNQERRASAQSPLARVIASAKRQGSPSIDNELGTSPHSRSSSAFYKASVTVSREATSPVHNGERHDGNLMSSKLERHHHPGSLQLQTGFSRQFSEELTTPTEITNIVRMIDESIDEQVEEEAENNLSEKTSTSASYTQRITERTHTEKLFLNIPHQSPLNMCNQSPSSSPPSSDDQRPTYAGVLRRSLPPAQPADMDLVGIEPQTPHTPAGFTTPNAEIDTDPLGILRNLNINSSSENHRTYKYFS